MPGLQLRGLSKAFGTVLAVRDVELDVPEGQLVCLLGPSGCGKTTLLRLIAGLETPSAGRVLLDGADLTATPAHRRGFGMVFQSLALFPHLTVGDNIAYGLRIQGIARELRRQRVQELLALVQLPDVAQRPITQLSGGQRQRVAIARALALQPKVFLLDEPLSALDAKLREAMQVELRLLQQRLGITTIVVTHDQREAMTMADLIVVMHDGRIQQIGAPLSIYRNPANTFVADFIGASNLLAAEVAGPDAVRVNGQLVRTAAHGCTAGSKVTLLVRPEAVHVLPAGGGAANCLSGTVTFVRDVGANVETYIDCAGLTLVSIAVPKDRLAVERGARVTVELPAADCIVLGT